MCKKIEIALAEDGQKGRTTSEIITDVVREIRKNQPATNKVDNSKSNGKHGGNRADGNYGHNNSGKAGKAHGKHGKHGKRHFDAAA